MIRIPSSIRSVTSSRLLCRCQGVPSAAETRNISPFARRSWSSRSTRIPSVRPSWLASRPPIAARVNRTFLLRYSSRGGGRGPYTSSSSNASRSAPPSTTWGGIPVYVWATAGGTIVVVFSVGYYSCLETVPMTQRTRWIATSPDFERRLGDQEYEKLLQSFQRQNVVLPPSHRASQTVQRVGSRIAAASQSFVQQYGTNSNNKPGGSGSGATLDGPLPPPPKYTYTVVRSDQANAFVLPGNHVFVLTGLFQYVWNEDELAAVLGHEIAHNVARHAGEKISQSLLLNVLARLSLLVDPSGLLVSILLPTATLFRELPHSRTQEMEADEIGVILSAMACYDPRAAERVFTRMAQGAGRPNGDFGNDARPTKTNRKPMEPPEFLSTHPSHESRIRKFETYMPRAIRVYEEDDFGGGERCRKVRRDMELARRRAAQLAAARGM